MKSKTLEQIQAVAKKFGVHVNAIDESFEGHLQYYLSFRGESVQGVYFVPDLNKFRLRRPGFDFLDGDCASAIAIALIRYYGFDYQSGDLVNTIRRSFD